MSAVAASVLTVEDDPIVRADLRLVLEGAGFSVCADAKDGIEAVELAREHEPDVILLDLGLPGLDGVEAARRILAERDVPIVALTGRSRRLAEEAVDVGARSYIMKPYGEGEVVAKLLDALAEHESRGVRLAREQSRVTLAHVLGLMGYPEEWAVDLERQAYSRGNVWRIAHRPGRREER
jgi:CheY-like chemotaxis protein